MKFLSKDGKVFDNQDDCVAYEKELHDAEQSKTRDYLELQELKKAYLDAFSQYIKKCEEYEKKHLKDKSDMDDFLSVAEVLMFL